MQPHTELSAQQEAIRELRARYEQGDLPLDHFAAGLDALLATHTPEEYQAFLQALPPSRLSAFDALTSPPAPSPSKRLSRRWLIDLMGSFQRIKHPWRMGQQTTALLGIGELALDLSLATMPSRSVLEIYGVAGEITLSVPRSVAVSVRAWTLLGEAAVFGETSGVLLTHVNETAVPAPGTGTAAIPQLEIRAVLLLGNVTIKQVDTPVVPLGEEQGQPPPRLLPQVP